ncbi:MAG: hypothetical protein OEV44_11650 [Spirochaetota bacterium]|nr:hypothetical protein [Spirochaetota bacterium]
MKFIANRFFSWMTYEPVIGLLMVTVAIILFIVAYKKYDLKSNTFWEWLKRIVEAGAIAIIFIGFLWAFRSILNDNYNSFRKAHGRVSETNFKSVKKIWGAPHIQRELVVDHFIEQTVKEEIPRIDLSKPPLYKMVKKIVEVEQNSILSSRGEANLKLSERKKGSALYNGFEAEFSMDYVIINDSSHTTEANFNFPLSHNQLMYDPFIVLENGKEISRKLRFSRTAVRWKKSMLPDEKVSITVRYKTRGVEYFYYQIPNAREINNFSFMIKVDRLPISQINYPEGCLPPNAKDIKETKDGKGTILEWRFNNTLTTAGMGIALPKPVQPGVKVALVLKNSPYAFMLLIIAICLTFLIQKEEIKFLELYLLSALYYILFLTLSSISDFYIGFWGGLVLGALLTMGLSFLLYRKQLSGLTSLLVLFLIGFFTLVYPLLGLFPDYQESFNGIIIIALIIYLFWLSWYVRIRGKTEKSNLI